jgi:hypothetical protein
MRGVQVCELPAEAQGRKVQRPEGFVEWGKEEGMGRGVGRTHC